MSFGEGMETSFETVEQDAEAYQEQKEQLDEREVNLNRALQALEQDASVQETLEANAAEMQLEKSEVEEKRTEALNKLEQIRERLDALAEENKESSETLKEMREIGEDVSEGEKIIADRREWLKECYQWVKELVEKLEGSSEGNGPHTAGTRSPGLSPEMLDEQEEHVARRGREAAGNENASPDDHALPQDPVSAYGQYMTSKNWGKKDYLTYTRDPEWKRLYRAAYPGQPLPALDQKTANQLMSEYMDRHNYGKQHFSEYSQDPEWRALVRAAWLDYQLPKLQREAAEKNLYKYMRDHNYGLSDAPVYQQDPFWQELHLAAYPEDITPIRIWAKEINPNYKSPRLTPAQQRAYEENCGGCAFALEQHFNGQDLQIIATDKNIPTDQEMEQKTGRKCVYMSPDKIEQILRREGAGSHLIVGINRRNPITGRPATGHWFNVYYDGKKVHTVDGQSGGIYEWPHDYGNVSEWCAMI